MPRSRLEQTPFLAEEAKSALSLKTAGESYVQARPNALRPASKLF